MVEKAAQHHFCTPSVSPAILCSQLDSKNPYAFYNRGISYDRMGDYASAIQNFSQAIQLEPGNADFYHNRWGLECAVVLPPLFGTSRPENNH